MFPWKRTTERANGPVVATLWAALLLAPIIGPEPSCADLADDERLEQFLARLGLVDLQIFQLERMLAP